MRDIRQSIAMVIFDWAGTLIDDGSVAPVRAIATVFARHHIIVGDAAIREGMGLLKRDHLRALLDRPEIQAAWEEQYGTRVAEEDLEELNEELEESLPSLCVPYARPLFGVVDTLDILRTQGVRLGSTTGFTRRTMDAVLPAARRWGVAVDAVVTADEVSQGRPWPWMIYRNMEQLRTCPPHRVVKVGDTAQDMMEARNAGAWAIGVVRGGNELGLPTDAFDSLAPSVQSQKLEAARRILKQSGAHRVMETITELPGAIEALADLPEWEGSPLV